MRVLSKKYYKLGVGGAAFNVFNVLLLLSFTFICIYPFYYIAISSFSSARAISRGVFLWPREFNLEGYKTVLSTPGIGQSAFISLSRTIIGTTLVVTCSTFVGYIFSYPEILFRKFLYRAFITTMYISAGFVPYYVLMANLGLRNNFLIYILPGALSAYFIILTKTYIESLPDSLREAAEIDGAGVIKIFFVVVAPLCTPIIACLVVFSAVGQWNSWADTLYYISNSDLYPLQYRLYVMLQNNMAEAMKNANATAETARAAQQQMTPTALRLTMTFITTVPILIVYPFMQRYFVKGMLLGAIKG